VGVREREGEREREREKINFFFTYLIFVYSTNKLSFSSVSSLPTIGDQSCFLVSFLLLLLLLQVEGVAFINV